MPIKKAKAKVQKKAKKRARQNWCRMVIRVRVPLKDAPDLKIWSVRGMDRREWLEELEVLSAYYDLKGQPDAMPPS